MITSLKLTNFMRHENLDVAFGPGLQVLRGANEAGKSSMLMGIAYALFGAKVLRTTFAEAVTWGKPESSLKVVLGLSVGGRELTVSRSKGGAEIVEGGKPIVTGQSEVTTFMSGLIGADANAAAKLMLANQGNLRGSLEQGPKATAQMIEGLADFDLFDRLIEAMQAKFVLGNTEQAEAAATAAASLLQSLPDPVAPDLAPADALLATLAAKRDGAEAESARLYAVSTAAAKTLETLNGRVFAREELARRHAAETQQVNNLVAQRSTLLAESTTFVTPAMIATQREAIAQAKVYGETAEAWRQFQALDYPKTFWDDTIESFNAAVTASAKAERELTTQTATLQGVIKLLKASLVTSSVCGYCGKDFSELPEIAAKNAVTADKITTTQKDLEEAEAKLAAIISEREQLAKVNTLAGQFEARARRLDKYVTFDDKFWPPLPAWARPAIPNEAPDLKALDAELLRMERALKAAEAAAAKLQIVDQNIAESGRKLASIVLNLEDYGDATAQAVEAAETAVAAAHAAWHASYQDFSTASIQHADLTRERAQAVKDYETAAALRVAAATDLATKREVLEGMRFSNTLLKKIRAARPIIADKLWNTVLAAVSTMFSRMRGETSVVTKDNGGFKVNGQAVESLSGSTLDLLGLAIRTALIKTFIPQCPFLILDEPGAAMDEDRVTALLGFVHATGFNQVVLVTHDSIAETVADNVIQL